MELDKEQMFDAPIPGMSLTHELGDRPWQSPAQFSSADEVADYYMERMSSEEFMLEIADVLEMGVPVTVLANTIQMGSVMNGVHSVDAGMLALPLIMEMMMMIGDSAGIKYDSGLNNPKKTRDTLLHKFAMQYENKIQDIEEKLKEEPLSEKREETKGLMARRK